MSWVGCTVERVSWYPCCQCSNSIGSLGLAALPASDPENAQKMTAVKYIIKVKLSVQVAGRDVEWLPRVQYLLPKCAGRELCLCSDPRGSHLTSHPVSSKECLLLVLHKPCASSAEAARKELGAIKLLVS